MANTSTLKERLKKLEETLNAAPLGEIIEILAKDAGIQNIDQCITTARHTILDAHRKLVLLSTIGSKEALETLLHLSSELTQSVEELSRDSATLACDNAPVDSSENAQDWKSILCSEANDLAELLSERETDEIKKHSHLTLHYHLIPQLLNNEEAYPEAQTELSALGQFCDYLVLNRINSKIQQNRIDIAKELPAWPILLPAIPELRKDATKPDIIEDLGSNIPGTTRNSSRGASRDFTEGSPFKITEQLVATLHKFSSDGYNYAPSHLREFEIAEQNQMGEDRLPQQTNRQRSFPDTWNFLNIWRRKAALLPKLSNKPEVIEKWTEAAMWLLDSHVYQMFEGWEDEEENKIYANYSQHSWHPDIEARAKKNREDKWDQMNDREKSKALRSALKSRIKEQIKRMAH